MVENQVVKVEMNWTAENDRESGADKTDDITAGEEAADTKIAGTTEVDYSILGAAGSAIDIDVEAVVDATIGGWGEYENYGRGGEGMIRIIMKIPR